MTNTTRTNVREHINDYFRANRNVKDGRAMALGLADYLETIFGNDEEREE